jgi:nuclear transcription factor Y gamma
MISAEAPILFAKACEIFILELTMRAWIHTEENKRRTLQRSDIATAISKTDVFDFLIDVVPREDMMKAGGKKLEVRAAVDFLKFLMSVELGIPWPVLLDDTVSIG